MNNYSKILDYLKKFHGDGKYYEFEDILTDLDKNGIKNIVSDLLKDELIDVKSKTGYMWFPRRISLIGDSGVKHIGSNAKPAYIPFKARITLKGINYLKKEQDMEQNKDSTIISHITNSQIVVGSINTNINISNAENQSEVIEIVNKIVEALKSDNSIDNQMREYHLQIFKTLLIQAESGQIDKETGMKALTVGDSVSSIGSFLLSLGQTLIPILMK